MTKKFVNIINIGGLGALLFFVGCNAEEYDQMRSENTKLSSELTQLSKKLRDLKTRERELKRAISSFESLQKKESAARIELGDITKYEKELKAALDYTSSLCDQWRTATRKSLIGLTLGLVRLTEGKVLSNAVVIELTESNVVLKHSEGQDSYDLGSLPESTRKQLLHEPTLILVSKIKN